MRMSYGKQTTLGESVRFSGIGVHSGKPATIVLHPADADRGIVFVRTDGEEVEIAARHENVVATELCTMIGIGGRTVATIEHLMAALAASGVDNVVVEIDGPEMPIADGCSAMFIDLIAEAGLRRLTAPRKLLRVLKPVRLEVGGAVLEFLPYDGTRYDVTIDFANPLIGHQSYVLDLNTRTFANDIARARTFGFMSDVEKLWKMGFALGSSLENSVAIGEDRILNPEGLRWPDEFARHKTLDAVGDLSLIGMPFIGHFRSYKGGHKLNWMAVKALVADTGAYEIVHDAVTARETAGGILQTAALAPSRD
ncbi:UDP-3-O-acyl-N-acetylglucosamine deacetylase [Pleomorphomonas sp. JP5]|uniref:UDP-3-O-acyl-N-acetylglucosamine deacetylase n=1 Tax=Pleomorphomonas sp. JP5 TaxID=2942998 RepID=UPI002043C822|nr:UDP-3-O-acyl-N-acetylglucosamine deacetylase [Pleomorphomonas sp. JP5]MCM5556939.1 UDP-3-O-acyl-N-acetylglucosamine deacetylase [Pleomorphomonas sp. JP5]